MSKAVRVRQGLIVRLFRRISETNHTGSQSYFGATDINQSKDLWADNPAVNTPELSLPPIPDICPLPALDFPLTDPLAVISNKPNQNRTDLVPVSQNTNPATNDSPTVTDTKLMSSDTLNVEELVQALEISGAKVKEVRALPTGGNCIKIEDLFVDYDEREFEHVKVRR